MTVFAQIGHTRREVPVSRPMKTLAVVIPCYNEADAIADVIGRVPVERLRSLGVETNVYVVDNNSSDATAAVARAAGATVISEPAQGKGHAIRTGFQSLPADVDLVAMLDGDDTYDPGELPRMVEPLVNGFADVVIGSRMGGRMKHGAMSGFHRLGNWVFTFMVRLVYRVNVTDVLTGYFAWKRPVVDDLATYLHSPGFAIEMEMVTKMARMGYFFTSVPVSYDPRLGRSALHPVRDGFAILRRYLKSLTWRPQTS